MKSLKPRILLLSGLIANASLVLAQTHFTEKATPLSKSAVDGYFYDVDAAPDGSVNVTFEFAEKKKQKFEQYQFDNKLTLQKQQIIEAAPTKKGEVKEDYTRDVIWASIGGSNSFDVLSTKLKLSKVSYKYTWNVNRQKYTRSVTNREKVVLKNVDDKAYEGYMGFGNSKTGELIALTTIEQKKDKQFYLLNIKTDMSFKEIPVKLNGKHTLVYAFAAQKSTSSDEEFDISDGDIILIFAPGEKSPDTKQYVFMRYDNTGALIEQFTFASPSPNLAITAGRLIDNTIYLFGSYTKSKDAFEEVFHEYGSIPSPGFVSTDKDGNENLRMSKYNKAIESEDMMSMVCMKIAGGKVEWLKDFPIKEMEKVAQKAPNQKKPIVYDGKALAIQKFKVLANGDMLVSGQITGRVSIALGEGAPSYKKLICFHFDKDGNIRAQYGAAPESIDDKFNTLFPVVQDFILSGDGNTIYWLVLENQSAEGYDGFMDAYNGRKTWYARYFPSIIQIDASKATLKNLEELGSRKYYLNTRVPYVYSPENKNLLFIGRDLKNKTLWLSNYQLN